MTDAAAASDPAAPDASAPEDDVAAVRRARVERAMGWLDALAETGVELAEAGRAEARLARSAEDPARALAHLALAHERAARAVRMTVVLQLALVNDPEGVGVSAAARAERARREAAEDDDNPNELVVRWVDPDWMTEGRSAGRGGSWSAQAPRAPQAEDLDITDADLERPLEESAAAVRRDLAEAAACLDSSDPWPGAPAPRSDPGAWQGSGPTAAQPPAWPRPRRDFIDALCDSG